MQACLDDTKLQDPYADKQTSISAPEKVNTPFYYIIYVIEKHCNISSTALTKVISYLFLLSNSCKTSGLVDLSLLEDIITLVL